jgi:alcohol sulfotransferase
MRNFVLLSLRYAVARLRLWQIARSTDAFLISYPKSGRTWLRFLLSNYFAIANHLETPVTLHTMFSVVPNFALDSVRGVPAFRFAGQIPRIDVSHFSFHPILFRDRPVVILVRDPRDVVVSSYFHAARHKHRFTGSIEEFVLDEKQGLPKLVDYLNGWAGGLDGRRHHVVSYEMLASDPQGTLEDVLTFLGVRIDEQALRQAIEASSFSAMREREMAEGIPAHDYDMSDDESLRMRRGKTGGYVDYLSSQTIGVIDAYCRQKLSPRAKRLLARTGMDVDGKG